MPEGIDRIHYHLTFGPTNTAIHEIAAKIELRQADIAAERARTLELPASMPRTRRGSYLIDSSRAFLSVGDLDAALRALQEARTVAPQQTRYHPMAREAVRVLASRSRKVGEDIRALASWMGSATTETI